MSVAEDLDVTPEQLAEAPLRSLIDFAYALGLDADDPAVEALYESALADDAAWWEGGE